MVTIAPPHNNLGIGYMCSDHYGPTLSTFLSFLCFFRDSSLVARSRGIGYRLSVIAELLFPFPCVLLSSNGYLSYLLTYRSHWNCLMTCWTRSSRYRSHHCCCLRKIHHPRLDDACPSFKLVEKSAGVEADWRRGEGQTCMMMTPRDKWDILFKHLYIDLAFPKEDGKGA